MSMLIVLMSILNGYGQLISGKVNYKIQPIDFESKSEDKKVNKVMREMLSHAIGHSFLLKFNNSKSSFVRENALSMNSISKYEQALDRVTSSLVTSRYNFFSDQNLKIVFFQYQEGILVKKASEKLEWDITVETKMVGGYLCYKAIYQKKFIGRDGKNKSIPIVAWFAPALPYSYGPKEYNGLPGLILELQEKRTVFYASNIIVSKDKELEIDFPSGKTITEEEYKKRILSQ
jgi:GLPGLI family protein